MKISNKYAIEAIVFTSYVLFAMAWVGGTSSMSQIMASMSVDSLASASFISGAVSFAKIVGTFLAAWIAVKVGIKMAFFISSLLVVVGFLTPIASNYEVLLFSRFLMGLGGALMIVYFNPIVMKWFSVEERSTINGLNAVAFNVGTAIILSSMIEINLFTGGWQNSLLLFSICSLVLAVLWLLVDWQSENKGEAGNDETPVEHFSYLDGLKDKFTWAYALCYSGLLAFYICLFTFYPKAGIQASSWVIWFGILGTIAGMIYSRKIKQRIPVIRWSGLVQVLTICGLTFSGSALVQLICAMILGFFVFLPITALVTIPHELKGMTPQKITVVFSFFWSISYLIATLVLWVFGYLVDVWSGDYFYAFVLITVLSSSFFLGSFFLPETNPKNKETV
ncbi:MAG: MFS transporter [Gammaproteobacteria bacterium]|nr:MFS transporter [Gammaproteobacteria bacterium]